ncbi:MAG TPA: pimeloyl-ACP methyl esterase BioG family protein [bacterium]|nr:pimeloyl-ACP methyl esterase BioG family protein [bacterium]
MKLSWLSNSENDSLIIFFSGWSVEPEHMKFLECGSFDVAMLYSYDSFDIPDEIVFSKYKEIIAITYSFGVFTGITALSKINFSGEVFAINGTTRPVDNRFGIRKMVFEKTLENLSVETFAQFQKNMFADDIRHDRFINSSNLTCDINKLKKELEFIRDNTEKAEPDRSKVRKVLISKSDRIFFSKNQVDFWKDFNYVLIDEGHFPFYGFKSWGAIVQLCRQ